MKFFMTNNKCINYNYIFFAYVLVYFIQLFIYQFISVFTTI